MKSNDTANLFITGRMRNMKAAIYHDIKDVKIEERENPVCGPNDVIVKTVRAGICGSDVNGYFKGTQYSGIFPNNEFGHEMVGYVTETGSEVADIKPCMKVFVQPITTCVPGKSNMLGAFSEYVRIPNARLNHNIYRIPDNLSYDEAVLIEPFAVGTRGKNVPGAKPGDHVVVYGAGTIGISCISALCAQGVRPVVVVRNNSKKAFLEKIGGIACNINEVDLFEFLRETFGMTKHRIGYPAINVDIVVDCAGAENIVDDFLKMMKPRSRLSVVGVSPKPVLLPMTPLMSSEIIIQGSCGYDDADIREVIDNLAAKKTYMPEIITHHYKLEDIREALEMAAKRDQAIKVVIDME